MVWPKIKNSEAYPVYFQPVVYTLRMIGMFARKKCQGLTILIVQPAYDTPEIVTSKSITVYDSYKSLII